MTSTAGCQDGGSPDRLDSLIWTLTELMLGAGSTYNMDAFI